MSGEFFYTVFSCGRISSWRRKGGYQSRGEDRIYIEVCTYIGDQSKGNVPPMMFGTPPLPPLVKEGFFFPQN